MLGVEDTVTEQCLERGLTRGCLCSGTATGSRQTHRAEFKEEGFECILHNCRHLGLQSAGYSKRAAKANRPITNPLCRSSICLCQGQVNTLGLKFAF